MIAKFFLLDGSILIVRVSEISHMYQGPITQLAISMKNGDMYNNLRAEDASRVEQLMREN